MSQKIIHKRSWQSVVTDKVLGLLDASLEWAAGDHGRVVESITVSSELLLWKW